MLGLLLSAALALQPLDPPAAADPGKIGETKDRLGPEERAQIIQRPAAWLDRGDTGRAKREFEALLLDVRVRKGAQSLAAADAVTGFALALYERGLQEQSLPYFRRAVTEFRAATSADDPEVALALHDLCDALLETYPDRSSAELIGAAEEVLRIRRKALGERDGETGMSYVLLGRAMGIPGPHPDRARAEQAAQLIRQGVEVLRVARNAQPNDSVGALFDLAMVYARHGMGPETVAAGMAYQEALAAITPSNVTQAGDAAAQPSIQEVMQLFAGSRLGKLALTLEAAGGDAASVEAIRAASPSATALKRLIDRAQQQQRQEGSLAPKP